MKNRPIIEYQRDDIDFAFDVVGVLLCLMLIGLPAWYYAILPDIIPTHFNDSGEPDGYGDKSLIWILTFVGLVLYIVLRILANFPHKHNYPIKITTDNVESAYKSSSHMIKIMAIIVLGAFNYISYSSIECGIGGYCGLGKSFNSVFLVILVGCIIFYSYKMRKLK